MYSSRPTRLFIRTILEHPIKVQYNWRKFPSQFLALLAYPTRKSPILGEVGWPGKSTRAVPQKPSEANEGYT